MHGDVARQYHHRHTALGMRLTDGDLQRARHLRTAGYQLAIVAAFAEVGLRMRFLEIPRTDLRRRDLRGDRKHGNARSMGVEKAVDQMQVARSTAAGAHGQRTGEVRFGSGGERGHFLVAHMDPLNVLPSSDNVGQPIETVTDYAVDALDAGSDEGLYELLSNGVAHEESRGGGGVDTGKRSVVLEWFSPVPGSPRLRSGNPAAGSRCRWRRAPDRAARNTRP